MNLINQFFNIHTPDQFPQLQFDPIINLPFVLFWKDARGIYRANNEEHTSVTGYNQENDIIGLTDFDLVWSKSAHAFRENDKKVLYNQTPGLFLESGLIKDKHQVNFLSAKMPLKLRTKKTDGILGMGIIFTQDQYPDIFKLMISHHYQIDNSEIDVSCLTQRQLDCLYYLVLGMTLREIGQTLKLSHKTVEHYLETVKNKLKCTSRSELIRIALKHPYIKNKLITL